MREHDPEERFAYIASLVTSDEERRKDRGEHEALVRLSQHHIDELSTRVLQFGKESREAGQCSIEADKRLRQRIQQLADESREANKRLEASIASLLSDFGLSQQPPR